MHEPTKKDVLKAIDVLLTQTENGYQLTSEDIIRAQHAARIITKAIKKAKEA
jgi:hypothetical protein